MDDEINVGIVNLDGYYKAFRFVETLFVQGRNLLPSRPAIG